MIQEPMKIGEHITIRHPRQTRYGAELNLKQFHPAKVYWSALGPVNVKTAKKFSDNLKIAIEIAQNLDTTWIGCGWTPGDPKDRATDE